MITGLLATALIFAPAELSVRVEGEGYLRFLREGRAVYARSATLVVERGELREKSGPGFLPPIRIASGYYWTIGEDGQVTAGPGKTFVGRLYLARFADGASFEPSGVFVLARDRAELGYPAQAGLGRIVAGTTSDERRTTAPILAGKPQSTTRDPQSPTRNTAIPQYRNTGSVSIAIPSTVEVDGPRFTLGEIAKIQGPEAELKSLKELDLGNAPVHGVPMLFTRERILAKVTLLGFDRKAIELDMPLTIQVVRRGQTISPDQLLEVARKAVGEKLGLKGELSSSDRLADIRVPVGKLELVSEGANLAGGVATVSLAIRIDGKRFTGRTIRLSGPSLETAVALGASVTVRFVSNGLLVELPGKARAAGAVGQTIDVSVTLPDSRETTTHQATVVSAGVVEVRL